MFEENEAKITRGTCWNPSRARQRVHFLQNVKKKITLWHLSSEWFNGVKGGHVKRTCITGRFYLATGRRKGNQNQQQNGERSSGNAVNNGLLIFFFVCTRQRHFGRHISPDGSAKVTVHAETSPIFYYCYIHKPADTKHSAHHACFETDWKRLERAEKTSLWIQGRSCLS